MSTILGHLSTAKGHVYTGKVVLQKTGSPGKNMLQRLDGLKQDQTKFSPSNPWTKDISRSSETSRRYSSNSLKDMITGDGRTLDEGFQKEAGKSRIRDHVDLKAKIIGVDGKHGDSVWGKEWGSENNKLNIDALGYEVKGEASLNIGKDGLNLNASGHAEVYLAKIEYEGRHGVLVGKAEAYVGAEANAVLDVNFNPLDGDANAEARVDAFAGGKAEVQAGVDGKYGKAGVNGGVSYGAGIEAGVDLGIKDGKVAFDLDFGATLGVGGNIGFEGEIDVKETAKSAFNGAKDIAGGAANGAKNIAGGAKDVAGGAANSVKDVAGSVKSITGKIPFSPWG